MPRTKKTTEEEIEEPSVSEDQIILNEPMGTEAPDLVERRRLRESKGK